MDTFKTLAHPYEVGIMQCNIILGGGDPCETTNQMLDMINALKKAGVQGIDKWIEKIPPVMDWN